ncbi:MAG: L-seryl-tRNA(Sec) selenium transferase [Candidatus Eisenbacteria bacterium]|nr:L-seryl-tRNA(Sec) selenium transferase [Candidatus Eisenbacteria bacterium]
MEPVERLRAVPSVEGVLRKADDEGLLDDLPRPLAARAVRRALDRERRRILSGMFVDVDDETLREDILERALETVRRAGSEGLVRVLNATGIVVHTNLGRAPLSSAAIDSIREIASGYSTLEFDLASGTRGSRHDLVRDALVELTGAGDALVTNNNAAAVLLAINTLAAGREVVVSRGELIEIGGSFRLPDVFARSGARMVEVGTTNRTRLEDYEEAVRQQTGCLMKAHWSNYTIAGFVETVSIAALAGLGDRIGVPVLHDLGSGLLTDGTALGLPGEPTVRESVEAGAGIVTMSGDKLLGGPQAGIIVGRRDLVARMRSNPLMRALRPGKLTLAALAATLDAYLGGDALESVPVPAMLTASVGTLEVRARALADGLNRVLRDDPARVVALEARAGGGSAPERTIPSSGVAVRVPDATACSDRLRGGEPVVVALVREGELVFDLRTVAAEDVSLLEQAIIKAVDSR